MSARVLLLVVLLALVSPATAQTDHAARAAAVSEALVPSLVIENEPVTPLSILERMAELNVPGVSIAFFDGGDVVWTLALGMADRAAGVPVTPATRFQAASISKPVAATAALDLIEEGRLTLDGDVNDVLTSWRVPDHPWSAQAPVTLRGLLTHTAGLTVDGFPGYAEGDEVLTVVGVLDGEGNTDPVRVERKPRTAFRYSGGGYTVAQQLIEEAAGQPFAEVLAERVLRPLGMDRSTFMQPLPDSLRADAAIGYRADGTPLVGRFRTYPERAAAGLWTTPTDLARWAIAIQGALAGAPHPVLDLGTVREMATRDSVGGHGLGVGLPPDIPFFDHSGANEGFQCLLTAQLDGGQGIVLMTNGDLGGVLIREIVLAVAREYSWAGYEPTRKTVVALSAVELEAFAGRYRTAEGPALRVEMRAEAGGLVAVTLWNQNAVRLAPESLTAFFDRQDGTAVVFEDPAGSAFAVQGLRFVRLEADASE